MDGYPAGARAWSGHDSYGGHGLYSLTMWRHCMGRAVKAYESNGSLFFHRQVTPFDVITARSFLEIIGTIMAGGIVMMGAIGLAT
jgi:capsular polysaccharide transport system permease protein